MDELRIVRREEGSLILANELGDEFRLVIDEAVAQEVRLATPRAQSAAPVRPREIQALLRSGKSRAEVAAATGLEEADVERFEEPVRAEQRYMLDLAHSVPVRTDPPQTPGAGSDTHLEQHFGQVVSERLIALGNRESAWRAWRDEETGWLIGLTFDSRDGEHDAVWSLDHKKRVLSPLTPDATNLSKMGEIGDRLIPKLRAVDDEELQPRQQQTFDPDALLTPTAEIQPLSEPSRTEQSSTGEGGEPLNADAEYERRREIDHLAVNTTEDSSDDLSQTADLLDALRRRRGERSLDTELPFDEMTSEDGSADDPLDSPEPPRRTGAAANIWGAAGVAGAPEPEDSAAAHSSGKRLGDAPSSGSDESGDQPAPPETPRDAPREPRNAKRGRSSIPSWDDILFGTRSDDDPS